MKRQNLKELIKTVDDICQVMTQANVGNAGKKPISLKESFHFELLKFENLFIMDRIFLLSVAQISSKKKYGLYFVIKNSLGNPVVMTHLPSQDDIEIFNKVLTKADPQAGLLFSLSYNANK